MVAELEPSVGRLLERHLAAARPWFPHAFVPWSDATDFDGPLGGTPWSPEQSVLPQAVQDALVVNLLTEDNLPSYHLELAGVAGLRGSWGEWVHRWTAEEGRHAEALRAYLHARRAVDPVRLEQERMRHVGIGHHTGQPTALHVIAYTTVQELATREAHRNTGRLCGDPLGEQLMAKIAADENLHMLFYRDLYADALQVAPDAAVAALADVICGFSMPGSAIPGFRRRSLRIAKAGIYNLDIHRRQVVLPLLRHLGIMNLPDLGPEGDQAQHRIASHLEHLSATAERFQALFTQKAGTPVTD
ncbi:putative acyl-[acyl-carrier-protein] desaturase desA1 [Streptomyces aurantiacus JA 4570]|uniref:Putative acyl-[acyl-carrier-protein] desaturase desA1 n=1 Tax=Streptomyces aurantiacus JA 4570 TaxID=1286094 RepID=S3ZTJ6_9ACTN|nr:putative acyl-[acyl-carrier-protein] desaturase desA1 [Streptomyces aurantiacus JA 4570]